MIGRGDDAADALGLDGGGEVGVGLVDDQGRHPRGVPAGDADHRGLEAHLDEEAVGRALEGGAGDDGGDGDRVGPGVRPVPRAPRAPPAAGRSTPPGSRGRPRPSWPRRWPRGPRAPDGRPGPVEADLATATSWRSLTKYSWKPTSGPSSSRSRVRSGSSVTGSSRTPTPNRSASSPVTVPERRALGQSLRPVEVGGEVLVAEVEPGDAAEGPRASMTRQVSPPSPQPGLGVDGVRERVEHRVEVGGDVEAVEVGVVPDVDHGRDVAGRDHLDHAAQQSGGAHAAGQGGDHRAVRGGVRGHRRRLPGPPDGAGRARGAPPVDGAGPPGMCKAHGVPPERPATAAATGCPSGSTPRPCSARPTGVGVFCAGALAGLAARDDVDVSAFAVSWRRRQGIDRAGAGRCGYRAATDAGPPAPRGVGPGSLPPLEWFVGRQRRRPRVQLRGPADPAGRPGGDRPRPDRVRSTRSCATPPTLRLPGL